MPRYTPPPSRGYREPPRTGTAGSVVVLFFGLILLAAAAARDRDRLSDYTKDSTTQQVIGSTNRQHRSLWVQRFLSARLLTSAGIVEQV